MYFIRISATYNPKNKPQDEAYYWFKKFNYNLVGNDDSLPKLLNVMKAELAEINAKHPRCGDLEITMNHSHDGVSTYRIGVPNHVITYFELIKVRTSL